MARLFNSFFMGGFECATHRRRDGQQIDVVAATRHDQCCGEDYHLLATAGITTVRDGLRWHLVESGDPGIYDWSSFLPMLEASLATGTQVIWDLCHWGMPAGVDPFSEQFVERFGAFAAASARVVFERSGGLAGPIPFYCPINEVSFWSWVGGDVETFAPHRTGMGGVLKRQLVRAALAAIRAVREVDPRARFVQAEPIIDITGDPEEVARSPALEAQVQAHTAAQFEAWDMLAGRLEPNLGGAEEMLDLLGVNYYWNNQWVHEGDRKPPGHPDHKPLHAMLVELANRYQRPLLITETGAEADAAVGWLGYIAAEVRQAQRRGASIEGVCLYPVMDYVGWDDERHCGCGLIEVDDAWQTRTLRTDLVEELQLQAAWRKHGR